MSRSRPARNTANHLTELVQTHVTPGVKDKLAALLRRTGEKEASYIRRLLIADLDSH